MTETTSVPAEVQAWLDANPKSAESLGVTPSVDAPYVPPAGAVTTPVEASTTPMYDPATVPATPAPVQAAPTSDATAGVTIPPEMAAAFQAFMQASAASGGVVRTAQSAAEPEDADEGDTFLTKLGTTIYRVAGKTLSKDNHNTITVVADDVFDVVRNVAALLGL